VSGGHRWHCPAGWSRAPTTAISGPLILGGLRSRRAGSWRRDLAGRFSGPRQRPCLAARPLARTVGPERCNGWGSGSFPSSRNCWRIARPSRIQGLASDVRLCRSHDGVPNPEPGTGAPSLTAVVGCVDSGWGERTGGVRGCRGWPVRVCGWAAWPVTAVTAGVYRGVAWVGSLRRVGSAWSVAVAFGCGSTPHRATASFWGLVHFGWG
jgi:hypothetical protein